MQPSPNEWKVQVLFGFGESKQKGGTIRRLSLLAALCMALAFVFAPMALAQDDLNCDDLSEAEEQAVFAADPDDSNNLDENDNGVPCENDESDNGSYALPSDEDDEGGGAGNDQYGADDDQYSPAVAQYVTETVSPTASPVADLPDTGGFSPALTIVPLALLLGSGLLAFRVVRRG